MLSGLCWGLASATSRRWRRQPSRRWSSAGSCACWACICGGGGARHRELGDPRDRALARFPCAARRGPRAPGGGPRALDRMADGLRLGAACRIWHRRLLRCCRSPSPSPRWHSPRSSVAPGRRMALRGLAWCEHPAPPRPTPTTTNLVMLLLPLAWLLAGGRARPAFRRGEALLLAGGLGRGRSREQVHRGRCVDRAARSMRDIAWFVGRLSSRPTAAHSVRAAP